MKRKSSLGRSLFILLAANALPLGGLAWFLVLRSRGEADIVIPAGAYGLFALLGAALVGILVLGWLAFPLLGAARDRVRAARRERAKLLAEGGLAVVWHGPVQALLGALAAFLWVDAVLVGLAVLALVGVEIGLLVKLGSTSR